MWVKLQYDRKKKKMRKKKRKKRKRKMRKMRKKRKKRKKMMMTMNHCVRQSLCVVPLLCPPKMKEVEGGEEEVEVEEKRV